VAVMREPVEQGRRHLRVAEHARPLGEVEVGRDHHARVLVEPAQQMEQQGAAGLAERWDRLHRLDGCDVAVQDHEREGLVQG